MLWKTFLSDNTQLIAPRQLFHLPSSLKFTNMEDCILSSRVQWDSANYSTTREIWKTSVNSREFSTLQPLRVSFKSLSRQIILLVMSTSARWWLCLLNEQKQRLYGWKCVNHALISRATKHKKCYLLRNHTSEVSRNEL